MHSCSIIIEIPDGHLDCFAIGFVLHDWGVVSVTLSYIKV